MSLDRKEPTLSNASSSLTNKESVLSDSSKKAQSARASARPRPATVSNSVLVKKEPSWLLWLTLLIALSATGIAAYGYWQLFLSQEQLLGQQQRISDLEAKLELSGDESAQSLTTLTANLKVINSDLKLALTEVDKLWATRNVNRTAITDLEQGLATADADIKQSVKSSLSALEASLNKPMQSLQQQSTEQNLLVQSLRERFTEQQSLLAELRDSAQGAVTQEDLSTLSQQIKAHDEAIKSIDSFRLSVNRDLLTLKQRSLGQASTTVPVPR